MGDITPNLQEEDQLEQLDSIQRAINILFMEASKEGERHRIIKHYPTVWQVLMNERDKLDKAVNHLKSEDEWVAYYDGLWKEESDGA